MKKLWRFLRSMRFGILLLLLIALCSVLGSVIPQGKEVAWYAQTYQQYHGWILLLGLNRVFQSWYFITLLVLLCLNLSLCSLVRIRRVVKEGKGEIEQAAAWPIQTPLTAEEAERVRAHLRAIHSREESINGVSILLVVIFGALALYLPHVTDRSCMPGESLTMEDGTEIYVDSFAIEDESGTLDYNSWIRVTLPDGRESGLKQIKVNYPLSFGNYKIYQQTYGTAGSITVNNLDTGGTDTFSLTDTVFLSADGRDGLWFDALYPGYIESEDGSVTLITSSSGHYTDPVYHITLAAQGEYTPVLAFPGESLTVGNWRYDFNAPVEYPGLRIKYTPGAVNLLLLLSFLLMIAGLYITFFLVPVLVKLDETGCTVGGPKPEGLRMEIELLTRKETDT